MNHPLPFASARSRLAPGSLAQDTIYAKDAARPLPSEATLPARTGVLVIGGGLTGLAASLFLSRAGHDVTLIEAGEIGNGASGRNGGQLHPGQRRDQLWLEAHLGAKMAGALWRLGEEAVALVHTLRQDLRADCDWRAGLISAAHTAAAFEAERRYVDHLGERYGVRQEVLPEAALTGAIGTRRYVGGVRDPHGGHLNPLALVCALSAEAHVGGARLHSGVRATSLTRNRHGWSVACATGGPAHTICAEAIVLAGNGYLASLSPYLEARIVPLANHIIATTPRPTPLIKGGEAVADTRAVIRYFREDRAGRMVFGGGESFGRGPRDVARLVRPYLAEVYPELRDAPIEAAWSGTLGITRLRMPLIKRLAPGLYVGAGYSGQGLGLATLAGKVIAEAISGEASRLDVFAKIPDPAFPGGARMQLPLAQLAMAWFAIRDRLGR